MSVYLIYGKHLKPWVDSKNKWREPDATFRALDYRGVRVSRLEDAGAYATREDAQEVLDRPLTKAKIESGEVALEIRVAK